MQASGLCWLCFFDSGSSTAGVLIWFTLLFAGPSTLRLGVWGWINFASVEVISAAGGYADLDLDLDHQRNVG